MKTQGLDDNIQLSRRKQPDGKGPSSSSAVLQALAAEFEKGPSRYGRPCLGGDCGCNIKLAWPCTGHYFTATLSFGGETAGV
ncbi:hypothetical protein KUCAC02_016461 [Chaenocephalus aceratus]|nr:hypothetical protein KUCAC02_016461 [Chaenocephalus aceratus]